MARETPQLIAQRLGGDGLVFLVPLRPLLPVVAAAPARHDEDAVAVAQLEEMVVFQLAFEAHGVEVHVADVAQFGFLPLRGGAQEHVEGVAGAAYENVLAVDVEQAMALGVDLGGDLADAELDVARIGDAAVHLEPQIERVEILGAGLRGPPEPRMGELLCETDCARLTRPQPHRL